MTTKVQPTLYHHTLLNIQNKVSLLTVGVAVAEFAAVVVIVVVVNSIDKLLEHSEHGVAVEHMAGERLEECKRFCRLH